MQVAWCQCCSDADAAVAIHIPDVAAFVSLERNYSNAPAAHEPLHFATDGVPNDSLAMLHSGSPALRAPYWCRFCDTAYLTDSAWQEHLLEHGGLCAYRASLLHAAGSSWPAPIQPRILRHIVEGYAARFHQTVSTRESLCACCATGSRTVDVADVDLRDLADLSQLDALFSARAYLLRLQASYPVDNTSFVGIPWPVLRAVCVPVPHMQQHGPIAAPRDPDDGWLLHVRGTYVSEWAHAANTTHLPLVLPLCAQCVAHLQRHNPRLPPAALANGNLALPIPGELQGLTLADELFSSARLHCAPPPNHAWPDSSH